MRGAKGKLTIAITGLIIGSVVLLIAEQLGSKFDVFAIMAPFIVLTLIAAYNYFRYVKK